MSSWTRRRFIATLPATAAVAACDQITFSGSQIDAKVRASRNQLFEKVPGTSALAEKAAGLLIVPEIKTGAFGFSADYGEGGLLIGDALVDYVSYSSVGFGLQIGAQIYSQALFFMTEQALRQFRVSDGWELGVDAEFTVIEDAIALGTTSNVITKPIYAVVYGQNGLIVGASFEGAKYSRLIR
jgi:lipid-binding SYLF domain-containing protein